MIFAVVANPSTAAIFGLFLTKFLFHFEISTIPITPNGKNLLVFSRHFAFLSSSSFCSLEQLLDLLLLQKSNCFCSISESQLNGVDGISPYNISDIPIKTKNHILYKIQLQKIQLLLFLLISLHLLLVLQGCL